MLVLVITLSSLLAFLLNFVIKCISSTIFNSKIENRLSLKALFLLKDYKLLDIIVVLVSIIVFVASYLKMNYSLLLLKTIVMDIMLLIVTFIDIKFKLIPNKISIITFALGILFLVVKDITIVSALGGMLIGAGSLILLALLPSALGGGDVKIMFGIGLFLGAYRVMYAIMLAFIFSAIVSIALLLLKKITRKDYIPFGPFLALGAFLAFHII